MGIEYGKALTYITLVLGWCGYKPLLLADFLEVCVHRVELVLLISQNTHLCSYKLLRCRFLSINVSLGLGNYTYYFLISN